MVTASSSTPPRPLATDQKPEGLLRREIEIRRLQALELRDAERAEHVGQPVVQPGHGDVGRRPVRDPVVAETADGALHETAQEILGPEAALEDLQQMLDAAAQRSVDYRPPGS